MLLDDAVKNNAFAAVDGHRVLNNSPRQPERVVLPVRTPTHPHGTASLRPLINIFLANPLTNSKRAEGFTAFAPIACPLAM
jgi:hypothetical protein